MLKKIYLPALLLVLSVDFLFTLNEVNHFFGNINNNFVILLYPIAYLKFVFFLPVILFEQIGGFIIGLLFGGIPFPWYVLSFILGIAYSFYLNTFLKTKSCGLLIFHGVIAFFSSLAIAILLIIWQINPTSVFSSEIKSSNLLVFGAIFIFILLILSAVLFFRYLKRRSK